VDAVTKGGVGMHQSLEQVIAFEVTKLIRKFTLAGSCTPPELVTPGEVMERAVLNVLCGVTLGYR